MTAISLAASARPKVPGRWTAWLMWRQQRGNLAGLTVLAGVLSVLLAMVALKIERADALGLRACLATGTGTHCAAAESLLAQASQQLRNLKIALLVAPALIGAFGGAPLVAREHESGVMRYSWTQGLPPERWLAGTLLLGSSVVVALMSITGILFNWATGLSDTGFGFTISPTTFAAQFPALPAWSLFAYILGVGCGMLIHRAVPAMGAALIGYGGVAYLAHEYLRPHYAAVVLWTPTSGGATLFWPYQAVEAAWLTFAAIVLALTLVLSPQIFRAGAWKRAGRRAK